jgi:hypothetical protein
MTGVRGEAGMKEGGAGNDSRSSGTIAGGILGGLRVDMGQEVGGRRRGKGSGGITGDGTRWDLTGTSWEPQANVFCQTRLPSNRRPVRIQKDLEDGTASDPMATGGGKEKGRCPRWDGARVYYSLRFDFSSPEFFDARLSTSSPPSFAR